jgi:hypothetical protein
MSSFQWTETVYPFGSGANSQTVPFTAGATAICPVDGSSSIAVSFPPSSSGVPIAVVVTPAPSSPQNQQLSPQVTGITASGFNLTCYGGLTGNSVPFFYIALLTETQNLKGGAAGPVATNGGSVAVTYSQAFATQTTGIVVCPNPATPTDEELSWEVTNVTQSGFTLTCYGGSGGLMPFTYIASGN